MVRRREHLETLPSLSLKARAWQGDQSEPGRLAALNVLNGNSAVDPHLLTASLLRLVSSPASSIRISNILTDLES